MAVAVVALGIARRAQAVDFSSRRPALQEA
jgi:hypothetical protein